MSCVASPGDCLRGLEVFFVPGLRGLRTGPWHPPRRHQVADGIPQSRPSAPPTEPMPEPELSSASTVWPSRIKDFTSRGGKARAESMSPDERRASASKAGTARWSDVSDKERSKAMQEAARARWGNKKRAKKKS